MCDLVGTAHRLALSRRGLLGSLTLAASVAITGFTETASAAHPPPRPDDHRTRLTLLGTGAGPVWWLGADRAGPSSAVTVGDATYLVDCGDGVGRRWRQTNLAPQPHLDAFNQLHAIFLTHLHSDHIIDYPNLAIFGAQYFGNVPTPIQVYGPGDRGGVSPASPDVPEPSIIYPRNPTPGTVAMSKHLFRAFANDLNDRVRDGGGVDPRAHLQIHDIALPAKLGSGPMVPPARISPFKVYEDDRVCVTATLVDHGQVYPAFGFRFDSDDGSVVFSGDTAPSDNLVELAKGADVLVHEVIDPVWVESLFGEPPFPSEVQALIDHLLGAHTTIDKVSMVAGRAGVRTLVLNHFVPADNPVRRWKQAKRDFPGRLVVGEDLMQLGIGARRG